MKKHHTARTNRSFEKLTALKRSVCEILKWTDLQYAEYQFEQGHAYLTAYLKGDAHIISAMERSRVFWSWWKNHWTNRDESFVEFIANTSYDLRTLREIYTDVHDAPTLAACIYPSGAILEESYKMMVSDFVAAEIDKR